MTEKIHTAKLVKQVIPPPNSQTLFPLKHKIIKKRTE